MTSVADLPLLELTGDSGETFAALPASGGMLAKERARIMGGSDA